MKPLQERTRTVVLSVAGLDPSGGAGVYSDVNTFTHFGLKGMAVPSVLTIQNDTEFKTLHAVEESLFTAMLRYMFYSYKVNGLKVGLITQPYHVEAVLEYIKKFKPSVTVLDTVINSSGGYNFWDRNLLSYATEKLIPSVDVITPNYSEAITILNSIGENTRNLTKEEIAKKLNKIFRVKVAVTGGDSSVNNKVTDVFYDGIKMETRSSEYFNVSNGVKHGTGCVFSAALTANMCKGLDFIEACTKAALFVEDRIRGSI